MSADTEPLASTSLAALTDGLGLDEIAVFCPVPLRVHPIGAEALDAHMVNWADQHGLLGTHPYRRRANFGLCQAAGAPDWRTEAIEAFGCYFEWGALWDEHLDSLAADPDAVAAHSAEALRAFLLDSPAPPPDDRWLRSVRDARELFERAVAPHDTREVEIAVAHMHSGWLWKYAAARRGALPSMAEYLPLRYIKSGVDILAAAHAPSCGFDIAPDDFRSPQVRAFTRAVLWPCVLINDVISLAKEIRADHPNVVTVLAAEHGIGLPEALARTWQLYERTVLLMVRLRDRLLDHESPAVARYARELPQWIPATLHWTMTSLRYFADPLLVPEGTAPLRLPALTVVDQPTLWDPADRSAPPYPELAWLWEHDPS